MFELVQTFYYTFLFYGCVLLSYGSPGTIAWKLFGNRKGKIKLIHRDLICDSETLMALPKSDQSLDEFTTAFSPFIPLLTLNGSSWQNRRKVLSYGLRKINIDRDFKFALPLKKGDIYWDIFENFFEIGFELVFGRPHTPSEFNNMFPGIADINHLIKRDISAPNFDLRWKLYHQVVALLAQDNKEFIFSDCDEFKTLSEIDRVSIVVEDLLTSICIQCTDLVCHMLLLYASHPESFKEHLDHCISETLRLYPLTDIWTRRGTKGERGWIASLIQLNRNGWSEPDLFKPERWDLADHPPLLSWGFDARSCPATKIGYNLTKTVFQNILKQPIWLQAASNFNHARTFSFGCQMWIGEGLKPSFTWKFQGKWKKQLKHWLFGRFRVLHQWELW